MKTGRSSVTSGYVAKLLNMMVKETSQKVLPFPRRLNMAKKLSDFGFDVFLHSLHSIAAGTPMAADAIIKTIIVDEKPTEAMPVPAAALPAAVANQIVALFLVACCPSRLGERQNMEVRMTAQYEDSLSPSTMRPAKKAGRDDAT
jgi:hypothetical protein